MREYTVAILGATGAVGQEMRKLLEERNFPVGKLKLLASTRSVGKTETFRGERIPIEEANEAAFQGVDLVLGAAENDIALRFAPAIRAAGAVFVDNSSAFRLDSAVPLVVPEVNPQDAALHTGIIANPNCSTIITVTAIAALNRLSPIRSMVASTYQAVSGAGVAGIGELHAQISALEAGETPQVSAFPHQIAYNLIPQIGGTQYEGYTSPSLPPCALTGPSPWKRPGMPSPMHRAAASWTVPTRDTTPCPWKLPSRISFLWAASGRISPTPTACASGAAAIRSEKAPPPMPFRLRSCYSPGRPVDPSNPAESQRQWRKCPP